MSKRLYLRRWERRVIPIAKNNDLQERPKLAVGLAADVFQQYYYLKEELVTFCRQQQLSTQGSKIQLSERIIHYLRTGEKLAAPVKKTVPTAKLPTELTLTTKIEENFKCTQVHRAFFESHLGATFKFNVRFQKWLKANAGRSYSDALLSYEAIIGDKTTTTIDKQFEYNTYIRAFFAANDQYQLQDAITCWRHKKSLAGHNRYEDRDLLVLEAD